MKTANRSMRYRTRLLSLVVILPLIAVLLLSTPALAAPVVILTPATGVAGTEVTITGTVFDSYRGDTVHIFFDNMEIGNSPLTVPDSGEFTVLFTIPSSATSGRHWIRVKSEVGSTSFLAENFFIIDEPLLILDIYDGQVGTEVTISGFGFYAGRTVTLYYYNVVDGLISTMTASPEGRFSLNFIIPGSTGGVHVITASNAEGNSAETEFEVIPELTLNLASAGPRELLTATGTGFGHRSKVNITLGTGTVATVRTDDYGNFEIEFNVPELRPNPYDVKAQDEVGNIDVAKFTITAGANLDKTTDSVGSQLTVKGSGFKANEPVYIKYDGQTITTVTADNNGGFTVTFDVPPSSGGNHVITITDGTTTKELVFTVESDPPQDPALMLPSNSSETKSEAFLDWYDVTDPSQPVAYNLQVASDQNFSSLVLVKEGLTESEYNLTGEERLVAIGEPALYFWRVKAIDSAGNESEWTAPWSFYINTPPVPLLLSPAPDCKTDTEVSFNWQAVSSLNPPVTYHFQIAADPDFVSIIFEKTDLLLSDYLLTEEDELELEREIPYYWRIKAIDSANNESAWSTPGSFTIEPSFSFPGWALYTLIGIVVIIVAFFAFRLGRRTAYKPPE